MDLMVMENLFYSRKISRIYDLKGSARSRYNPNTSGTDKVLLDMNLLETLRTEPIFLGSKAKRSLERAIWNDTNFLAVSNLITFLFLMFWLICLAHYLSPLLVCGCNGLFIAGWIRRRA